MKNACNLSLPGATDVAGKLYLPSETAELTDSMLTIKVGDYGIDVSWYPDRDPSGKYYVNIFDGDWDNSLFSFSSEKPAEVARLTENWVRRLAERAIETSTAPGADPPNRDVYRPHAGRSFSAVAWVGQNPYWETARGSETVRHVATADAK